MCKHFNTPQGCTYGDKCQFAHGAQELRLNSGGMMTPQMMNQNKAQNNAMNYKIVKCKNWEKDKTCKYGSHCTFAHGDEELRNKSDNMYPMNMTTIPMMVPMNMVYDSMPMVMQGNPGMDFMQMQMMTGQNPMMMGMMSPVGKNNDAGDKENQQ